MIKVSVIIPVYNAQTSLLNCIESLLNQTLKDIEYIFINDGSYDKSQEIIESFEKNDKRFLILNQENKGVSVARNNGIKLAKGEYIGFVDADDYVDKEYFDILYYTSKKNDVDIVISSYMSQVDHFFIKKGLVFTENTIYDQTFIEKKIIPTLISESSLNTVWNKLYRSSLIKNNSIIFPKGIALGEDNIFNLQAFNFANSILFNDFPGYHYCETNGSATKNIVKNDCFARALEIYQFDYNSLLEKNINNLKKYKSIRLFNNTVSYIDVYLRNANGLDFFKKYKYVKNMINHVLIQSILIEFRNEVLENKSKYQRFIILKCIKKRNMFLLLLINQYSQFKNKK